MRSVADRTSVCGAASHEGGLRKTMTISLTDVPDQVFVVPCDRHDTRYLAIRSDDSDGEEAVLFVAEATAGFEATVSSMVETGVVLKRSSAALLAHALLDVALRLQPQEEEDDTWLDPESNGHGGL